MLIQFGEWCYDKNVMLFIRLHRSSPHDVVYACTIRFVTEDLFSVKTFNLIYF